MTQRRRRLAREGSDGNYVNAFITLEGVTLEGVPRRHPQREGPDQSNGNAVMQEQELPSLNSRRERSELHYINDVMPVQDLQLLLPRRELNYVNDVMPVQDLQSLNPRREHREAHFVNNNMPLQDLQSLHPRRMHREVNFVNNNMPVQDLQSLNPRRDRREVNFVNNNMPLQDLQSLNPRRGRREINFVNNNMPLQDLQSLNPRRGRRDVNFVNNNMPLQDLQSLHPRREGPENNYANDVVPEQGLKPLLPRREVSFANDNMPVQGLQSLHPRRERPNQCYANEVIIVPLQPLYPQRERPDQNHGDITVQGVPPHHPLIERPEGEDVHKTTYMETMMQLCKGNIGTGCYAMGVAFKNGGLLFGTIVTLLIGFVCVHCQHVLINCAKLMQDRNQRARHEQRQMVFNNSMLSPPPSVVIEEPPPDFAETVGMCFRYGPRAIRRWATPMRRAVNVLICVSQLGLCCIYFVFISSNFKQIADRFGLILDVHLIMALLLVPVILTSIITKLKFLSYCSLVANVLMAIGIGITFYYALKDPLPPIAERRLMGSSDQLPLFYGIAIFAFEGIALVLPLQNEMKEPAEFGKTYGVLNVGMVFVVLLYTAFGFVGYLRWGDAVEGTMTLNLPDGELLAESVKVMISTGVLLGFALQFFVAIMIMWPTVMCHWRYASRHPGKAEMMFRVVMVLITFVIAECVPKLSLFISLIGAFCSSALALIIPPVIELIVEFSEVNSRPHTRTLLLVKNGCILLIALVGFGTGTYQSLSKIIQEF
ncbi:proton-coupled amino acid transporter-like protein pathetic [Anopheles bellator]|uniref:proton-coupled amino acid transporter-like protein pathetic n=1 Tax=Anopheles bellator TaxID=139047 RepID=UPI0026480D58|nr:proton-coupled amino acid transporter-like protein pathetic [Anopheles bellator]